MKHKKKNNSSYCNDPPGAAARSASRSPPVRPSLLLFTDSSSLPRSLLRVAIIRSRIVATTALHTRPLDNCPMVSAASIYRSIPPQGGTGVGQLKFDPSIVLLTLPRLAALL
ncbi:conserved hypothetical protein [Trichinella spiralis]|uniref:hypothetical protein n=1 Tax=Trichinella spiralis TaxID=6334 RepID=UPI0001EFC571|nr:conserved hypothetical protein [Trichinella spiralis]